jgi:hypothetical protein
MADFVAVIRRAVDGLATNTPDARAKVYEKARSAVQRQLENMKPRPPEEMLRRQMDKLQAAIDEVEAEHQEALAPAEDPFVEPVPEPEPDEPPAPVYEEPAEAASAYEDPAAAAAPESIAWDEEPARPAYHDEPEHHQPAPVAYHEPVAEPEHQPAPEPDHHPAMAAEAYDEHRYAEQVEATEPEPAQAHDVSWEEHPAYEEPARLDHPVEEPAAPPAAAMPEQLAAELPYEAHEPYAAADQPVPETAARDLEQDGTHWRAEEAPQAAQQADDWTWQEPQREHEAEQPQPASADVAAAWDDVPELVSAGPAEPIERGPSAEGLEAHFDQETHVSAAAVRMPPVADLPDLAATVNAAPRSAAVADDPFADHPAPQQPAQKAAEEAERDPWGDLEDLIGYNSKTTSEPAAARNASDEDDFADLMPPPVKPFRVQPTRKRNYGRILLAVIGLLILGGGAYAIWLNRDSFGGSVGALMQSDAAGKQPANEADPAPSAAAPTGAPTQTANQAQPASTNGAQASAAPATQPAAPEGTKFTQRLMPDGKEVDEGPGGSGELAQNAEGQSVAQLNAPPATPATAGPATGGAPAAPAPAPGANEATPSAPAPSATPGDTPAVAGEKMFLYEERIGQSAPTAVDGTVSWSLQREPGANGAVPEPVVQGRITIPGRGLTALMTFKRNTDPSLPASHLIEIVFAVPPDFEGGAIDSVQRIAMKQTEQDRGNALIAVPAKITDDFHMIALNDFPDARNTNMELLRSRNWIDIPVAYRNGRRALLTLQKGPEGEKAFNEAIREWGQMGNPPSGQ